MLIKFSQIFLNEEKVKKEEKCMRKMKNAWLCLGRYGYDNNLEFVKKIIEFVKKIIKNNLLILKFS